MKKLLVSVLAIAGLVACSQDTTLVQNSNNGTLMEFNVAALDNATRVDPSITLETLDGFDVWAYVDSKEGTVLTEERVSLVNGAWSYVNKQYWTPGHDYFFTAIAPVDTDIFTNHWTYKQANDTIAFTNVEGTEDLLLAQENVSTHDLEIGQGMPAVGLQFNHLLSKVKFTFKNGFTTDNVYVAVENVEMDVPAAGTYTTTNGTWALENGTTTLVFGDVTDGETLDIDGTTVFAAQKSVRAADERFTIPAGAGQNYVVRFTVKHYNGDVCLSSSDKEVKISGLNLEKGKAYNFVTEINEQNAAAEALLPIEFTVEGVNEWDETEVEVYDGYFIKDGDAFVESANGLVSVAEQINNGDLPNYTDIILEGDIDLNDLVLTRATTSNWTPIGTSEKPFTGTFDGKGYTIKNLTLVESEAKEGKAYVGFFGYAENVTIKNVTFENVYINIPCLDIDHSQGHIGAVAGSLEGTSTIENVTVKGDVTVYTTQSANGASRVAVIAGGNSSGNVTMKNVHVVANEGSSLIANNNVGALAGQLQGKMYFENCSSNIDVTANKFFAGGLVGIAAGDSHIKNCHTTGDVAVVAGREGRHNDEYRVGGIAGGWADGKTKVFTLEGCTYTGTITGKNSDGTVVENFDYAGYVGRGYTLSNCAGSKVIVNRDEYVQVYDTTYGVYYVNGAYEVNTAADLKALANDVNSGNDFFEGKTVVLTANVDLKGENWTPIGSVSKDHGFMGNFDGNGFAIKNLAIENIALDSDGYAYAGLFGVTEGVDEDNQNYIKNLVIENVNINTNGHIVAAAIAYPYYTVVENVTVKGNVSIKGGDYTAGILAYTRRCVDAKNLAVLAGTIEGRTTVGGVISDIQMNGGLVANYSNFKASGVSVKGANCVGGISGIICLQTLDGATVENVTIVCDDTRKGIVAGSLGGDSTINRVSVNNVSGADYLVGPLYGTEGRTVTIDGVVYEYNADGSLVIDGKLSVANGVLADDAAYYISNKAGMFWFANEVNVNKNAFDGKTVKLTADVDLNNELWTPVGQTGAKTFNGVFDGQNYTIYNLNVDSSSQTGAHYSSGLFGWVETHSEGKGILKNVKIENAAIKGNHNCGALVGYITEKYARVQNCHVVNAAIECHYANGDADGDKAGALIGNATNATLVDGCSATNSTVSAGRDAGQLIGAAKLDNVTNCSATNVTVENNGEGTGKNIRNEVVGRVL